MDVDQVRAWAQENAARVRDLRKTSDQIKSILGEDFQTARQHRAEKAVGTVTNGAGTSRISFNSPSNLDNRTGVTANAAGDRARRYMQTRDRDEFSQAVTSALTSTNHRKDNVSDPQGPRRLLFGLAHNIA